MANIPELTPRQRQVLRYVVKGMGSKEIASALNISVKTVEFHRARLLKIVNAHNTAALVRHAMVYWL